MLGQSVTKTCCRGLKLGAYDPAQCELDLRCELNLAVSRWHCVKCLDWPVVIRAEVLAI